MGNKHAWKHGQFCWTDLGTTDQEGAKKFYGALFGWDIEDNPMPGDAPGQYSMCRLGDDDVGGAYQMSPEMGEMPPNWACYVSVDDVDARTAKAKELGAKVLTEPFDIPETGRMCVLQDPTGAVFCLWQNDSPHSGFAKLDNKHGSVGWFEIVTHDVDKAGSFYSALLGWEPKLSGDYYEFYLDGEAQAGMMKIRKEWGDMPSHWGIYFAVDDVDQIVKKTEELGGRVLSPPMDIENVGRFATMMDPQGAAFAVLTLTH